MAVFLGAGGCADQLQSGGAAACWGVLPQQEHQADNRRHARTVWVRGLAASLHSQSIKQLGHNMALGPGTKS